jgi:hypothetical protein
MLKYNGKVFQCESALRNYLNKFNVCFKDGILRLLDHHYAVHGPVDLNAVRAEMIETIIKDATVYSYRSINGKIYSGSKEIIKRDIFASIDSAEPHIDGGGLFIYNYRIQGCGPIRRLINRVKKMIGEEIDSL